MLRVIFVGTEGRLVMDGPFTRVALEGDTLQAFHAKPESELRVKKSEGTGGCWRVGGLLFHTALVEPSSPAAGTEAPPAKERAKAPRKPRKPRQALGQTITSETTPPGPVTPDDDRIEPATGD